MTFSASVYQNEFLPDGANEVNAVVTVTGDEAAGGPSTSAEKAVVLIVDTSGSMDVPGTKIRAARRAAATAIRLLPDGTLFGLVAGTEHGRCAYPPDGGLVAADDHTRAAGAEAAEHLRAGGGTAMSTWLDRTTELLQPHAEAIRLAYLLTDGINQGETRDDLDGGIARAAGVFQCDTRGVGADWEVEELRHIASGLLGEVDIIKQPDQMDDDFQAFMERAMGKSVADVRLRMWTPKGSTVRFVRQVAPTVEDLTGRAVPVNALTNDYPTGAWSGDESRDYHVCVDVLPAAVGDERLAARISLMVGDDPVSQGLVRAVWTDDEALSTRINAQVAHYTGQVELAQAIQEGLQARKDGDLDTATVKLGRAVQLATASGNEGTVKLLKKVVEVEDAESGTVRVRRDVEALDEMELDTRSTRTVRVQKGDPAPPPQDPSAGTPPEGANQP